MKGRNLDRRLERLDASLLRGIQQTFRLIRTNTDGTVKIFEMFENEPGRRGRRFGKKTFVQNEYPEELKALERARSHVSPEPFRVVTRCVVGEPNLASSTCTRRLSANGQLTEIVAIDGFMNDEDLEKFIQSFPVERV